MVVVIFRAKIGCLVLGYSRLGEQSEGVGSEERVIVVVVII